MPLSLFLSSGGWQLARTVSQSSTVAAREAGPRPVGSTKERRVGLDPQPQQAAVLGRDQPPPESVTVALPAAGLASQLAIGAPERQLVAAGPREQRADQPVLAAEQEQQHARAGPDRRGQRAQRQVGEAVLEDVPVCGLQQLLLPAEGVVPAVRHAVAYVTETVVSVRSQRA